MANPQKENGYTAIANELLEQIYSCTFNATQLRIMLLILRFTYGFNRKSHDFALNFIKNALNADRRNIQKELKNLFDANIIVVVSEATFNDARQLAINKNYDEWDKSFKNQVANVPTGGEMTTPTGGGLTTPTGGGLTTPTGGGLTTQENKYKDNNKDNIKILLHGAQKTPCSNQDAVIFLTLNDKTEYPIFEEQWHEWAALYPAVDVIQQLRNMKGWLDANPSKRKTKRGIQRFINNWLIREQDKGGNKKAANPMVVEAESGEDEPIIIDGRVVQCTTYTTSES